VRVVYTQTHTDTQEIEAAGLILWLFWLEMRTQKMPITASATVRRVV